MRSPIIWFGGKGNMVKKLLKLIPSHKIYVEVFGGGGSLLFAKKPSPIEIYNDLDSGLVNFFRVLRDQEKFKEFHRLVSLTPYSREEYYFYRETWKECENDIERAYRWFIVARMSFSGRFGGGWNFIITRSNRNMAGTCSQYLSIIEELPEIHQRIMRVQIEHKDFRELIPIYDTSETLFYCDPPYISETRNNEKYYKCEMSIEDHKYLVDLLLQIKGKALLSGYQHPIYKPLEDAGWIRKDYKTACHAAGRTRYTKILGKGSGMEMQPRIESVWISPNACIQPTLL